MATDDSEILPDYFSWNDSLALNDIQNQGKCGACSVFSVMSIMETYYYNKFKEKKNFQNKELLIVSLLMEIFVKKEETFFMYMISLKIIILC